LDRVNPILSDRRGSIYVYERWFDMDLGEKPVPQFDQEPDDFVASNLFLLRLEIRTFLKKNGGGQPPSSLSQLGQATPDVQITDPNSRREGPYILKYFAPRANDPGRYAISADCQSYGDACIRSFFLDYGGEVHQTAEPRAATAQDPFLPECEKFAQTCRDLDWPVPSPAETTAQ